MKQTAGTRTFILVASVRSRAALAGAFMSASRPPGGDVASARTWARQTRGLLRPRCPWLLTRRGPVRLGVSDQHVSTCRGHFPESCHEHGADWSALNAHYTDAALVAAIWDGLAGLGFEGRRVLEAARLVFRPSRIRAGSGPAALVRSRLCWSWHQTCRRTGSRSS